MGGTSSGCLSVSPLSLFPSVPSSVIFYRIIALPDAPSYPSLVSLGGLIARSTIFSAAYRWASLEAPAPGVLNFDNVDPLSSSLHGGRAVA